MSIARQLQLRTALERRVRASGFSDLDALTRDGNLVCVVLSAFQLERYATDTLAYLACVPEAALQGWYRSFTKTLFLLGDPQRLAQRQAFAFVADDGRSAWTLPMAASATTRLRRLLKKLQTHCAAKLPERVTITCSSKGGKQLHLTLDARGLTLETYLVHLNHTLCEAFIEGQLRDAGTIVLDNLARELLVVPETCRYQRVQRDPRDETRLRLFACLHTQVSDEVTP